MNKVAFENAYYIKLGKNGIWEESGISENKLRIGWDGLSLDDINKGRWEKIEHILQQEITNKGAATRDLNALKMICHSSENDIWITFYSSKLWWCRVGKSEIYEDKTSKYRTISEGWFDKDVNGNILFINQISGKLSKTLGFRGTACRKDSRDVLKRLINDQPSKEYIEVTDTKNELIKKVEEGIKNLYWKDFETLVDLLFRQSGWRRISRLGETMKYIDLELEEPITGDLFQVQIKSRASKNDFIDYAKQFASNEYRKLYFVVHSPDQQLVNFKHSYNNIEMLFANRLSEMVIELGLINWLLKKIK